MKATAAALILATLFVLGRADVLRLSLGDKAVLEHVMNGRLASAMPGRHLAAASGGDILSNIADAASSSPAAIFSSFVKNIVGEAQDYSQFDPNDASGFDFGALGAIDVQDPVLKALSQLTTDKPKSVLSVEETISDLFDQFCDPATCTAGSGGSSGSDPASSCTGKSATLALEPWSCTLDLNATALECTPAVLVLQKTPAKCSLSSSDLFSKGKLLDKKGMDISGIIGGGDTEVTYTGQSCQVTKTFGQAKTDIYGADPFSFSLGALLGRGIDTSSGTGSASVSLDGDIVGNATATGGR